MWRRHTRTPERTQYALSGLQMVGETGDRDPEAAVQYIYTENSYEPLARVASSMQKFTGITAKSTGCRNRSPTVTAISSGAARSAHKIYKC
ncbi:hypothetical protein Y71_01140 [Kosakonia radicincitans DSM 16656]|nr:hypothetical protein Y71_01140 [Kosakonia radicincitans DSM 16656]